MEMTIALQGPAAGLYLRDMGAEVIKVEPPIGDSARHHRGANNSTPPEALTPAFIAANRGKKSVCVDVHTPTGREVVKRLLDRADVFLTNYREEFLKSMGLDYDTLHSQYPQLVYAQVNGFGPEGKDRDKPMLDGAAQARGGIMSLSGPPGQPPSPPGAAIADLGGAMQLALGVMTGLFARSQHGVGQKVSTSSLGAQLWLQQWELQQSIIADQPLRAEGAHLANIQGPYGVYETSDGGAFMLAVAMDEESWDALCIFAEAYEIIGDPDWNTQGKRMGSSGKGRQPDEIRAILRRGFLTKTTAEWVEFMYDQPDIIMERVRGLEDVITDEQNIANEYIVPMTMPIIGETKVVGNLVRMSETPGSVKGPAPELGAQNFEVLSMLGFSEEEIEAVAEQTETVRAEFALAMEQMDG
ncbi:MAG TPA: CoA transferase [Gammaproteobacteria bacterium]|nr:CoA transferase [Gammaproteobacteria bacterium]